jgi:hypothetical protein
MKNFEEHVASNDTKAISVCNKASTIPQAMRVISIDFYIAMYYIKTKILFSLKVMGRYFTKRTLECVTSLLYARMNWILATILQNSLELAISYF